MPPHGMMRDHCLPAVQTCTSGPFSCRTSVNANVQDILDSSVGFLLAAQASRIQTVTFLRDPPQLSDYGIKKTATRCESSSALCRVVGELLRLSHPAQTQYYPLSGHWVDGSGKQTLDPTVFSKAGSAVSRAGLLALAQLLGRRVQFMLEVAFASSRQVDAGMVQQQETMQALSAM